MRALRTLVLVSPFVFGAGGVALAHAAAATPGLEHPQLATAPSAGCSLASLKGNYAINGIGVIYGAPFAMIGTASLDGTGHISGLTTEVVSGTLDHASLRGTYTMGSDCRGTAVFDTQHENRFDRHSLELVAADGGREAEFILTHTDLNHLPNPAGTTDAGVVINGYIKRM
jgi:hypothetical protein